MISCCHCYKFVITKYKVKTKKTSYRTIKARYKHSLVEINCMVCITECTDKPPPVNGSVVDNGTYASFTCDVGFNLIGHSTSVCHEDGSGWSSITPTCSK